MKMAQINTLKCFACGICIGPGYDEYLPSKAGNKSLCGWCYGTLNKQGYIQLDSLRRLLPDGRVIQFRQKVNEELEGGTG